MSAFSKTIFALAIVAVTMTSCNNSEFGNSNKPASSPQPKPIGDPAPPPAIETGDSAAIKPGDVGTTLSFAEAESLHVGDGEWGPGGGNSRCKDDLKISKLLGTTFKLEFDVLEDNTEVRFSVDMVCGLDNDKNWVGVDQLPTDATPIAADRIALSEVGEGLGKTLSFTRTLNLGKHFMSINSAAIGATTNHDDLMVGKITLTGDKPIKRGEIQAQK